MSGFKAVFCLLPLMLRLRMPQKSRGGMAALKTSGSFQRGDFVIPRVIATQKGCCKNVKVIQRQ